MKVIYLVKGSTGEYSDTRIWEVRAFTKESEATNLALRLNALARQFKESEEFDDRYHRDEDGPIEKEIRELDEKFECDYTGTDYDVSIVPLTA